MGVDQDLQEIRELQLLPVPSNFNFPELDILASHAPKHHNDSI